MDADGGSIKKVSAVSPSGDPLFSPEGTKLLYVTSDPATGLLDYYVTELDEGDYNPTKIASSQVLGGRYAAGGINTTMEGMVLRR